MTCMKEKAALLATASLVTGAIAAGCGDDKVAALSKSEFIAQADALCQRTDAEFDQTASESSIRQPALRSATRGQRPVRSSTHSSPMHSFRISRSSSTAFAHSERRQGTTTRLPRSSTPPRRNWIRSRPTLRL